jgi:excisionase family DNA binding protein
MPVRVCGSSSSPSEPPPMPEQLQFPFPSLDFPGRVSLRVEEVAARLNITRKHVTDLIAEGKFVALDHRGLGSRRATYRIPIESYRDYVAGAVIDPTERFRLMRSLPRATLIELQRELKTLLAS